MWRSLWRSIDRFSLQHFKYVIGELRRIEVVDKFNRDLVIDLLQSIVEIVTYGDRQDPLIFECFMEYQVLAEFVRVLKISKNSRIEAPLLQYLSIMIQNMDSEHAIYYCLSNDYINSIITHQFKFDGTDLASYYISFLRAVSSKLNRDTLCLLVKVQGDVVVSFPLYSEALKFAQHGEKMIQTAVRALTLNIYNVSDDMVHQFITSLPVSKYFMDLVYSLKEQSVHLDNLVHGLSEKCISQRRKELLLETDKIVDDLYYFKDILCVGESRLNEVVEQNLVNMFAFPILLSLLPLRQIDGLNLSAITSFYLLSRLIQVVGGQYITNSVARVVLYHYMSLSVRNVDEESVGASFSNHLNYTERLMCSGSVSEKEVNGNGKPLCAHLPRCNHLSSSLINSTADDNVCLKRSGILEFILSNNHGHLLAALYLLLTLAESKDLDYLLELLIGVGSMQHVTSCSISSLKVADQSIFTKFMPQISNALLKVLASEPCCCVLIRQQAGWLLLKLLALQGKKLDDNNLLQFITSYEQSRECLQRELDGCWFDYILDTLRNEWASCKAALEQPSQTEDPFFLLEHALCQQISAAPDQKSVPVSDDATTSHLAWKRMVDAVKVFIAHVQLKSFIWKGKLLEKPLSDSVESPPDYGRTHASDLSSASFGSEVSLGSGIPCRIAFPNAGIRDIYLIPVASGVSGRLLLVEKHPFRSQRGVVLAMAPLAGLSPKIDADHPTWLHLSIREFDPKFNANKGRSYSSKASSNHNADGRWTLGFANAKACETACLLILEETSRQRSSVSEALATLLQSDFLVDLSESQNHE
ncbi:hypothetical protein K2173_012136 [Erythroxylum novogranatense]|uniref:FPL domain-containing protein n=1 Tax=Erythroxylum novogranatense TaxID=1862640 RepID=A0AAV8SR31_9ROSI|nr:hypothetical protein K2173_012136 [Erythroxylum novogranatense]